jgi:biopolymer transport protein TolR
MSMGKMSDGDDDDDIVAEINMTPLIDIMLVLLVVFMVSSSVALESGMDIELPKTALTNLQRWPRGRPWKTSQN